MRRAVKLATQRRNVAVSIHAINKRSATSSTLRDRDSYLCHTFGSYSTAPSSTSSSSSSSSSLLETSSATTASFLLPFPFFFLLYARRVASSARIPHVETFATRSSRACVLEDDGIAADVVQKCRVRCSRASPEDTAPTLHRSDVGTSERRCSCARVCTRRRARMVKHARENMPQAWWFVRVASAVRTLMLKLSYNTEGMARTKRRSMCVAIYCCSA